MNSRLEAELLSIDDVFSDPHTTYEIPIYQRNYAWGVEQIEQLIDDVWVASKDGDDTEYFLGNIVVARKVVESRPLHTTLEVIDGQQRLTTLFMLLAHLDVARKSELTYQSRRDADRALINLKGSGGEEVSGIHTGYAAIAARMARFSEPEKASFISYLRESVNVVLAELPASTDLNRYFEIMNTRGQQLQQVDIVKARLMSFLRSDANDPGEREAELQASRACFAWVWEACADMDSYIQMALTPGDTELRQAIFGADWNTLRVQDFDGLTTVRSDTAHASGAHVRVDGLSLRDAIASYSRQPEPSPEEDEANRRFESPIKFPSLLLHVLKVMSTRGDSDLEDEGGRLNDNKLIAVFESEFATEDDMTRSDRVRQFAHHLLRCKFLLDNFVIKREYTATNGSDGAWSLKRLGRGESESLASGRTVTPRFSNTYSARAEDWDGAEPTSDETRRVLLLQSMLRVTYTSPRTMHWITAILRLPLLDRSATDVASLVITTLTDYARAKVRETGVTHGKDAPKGFAIERIVYTYVDYLLATGAYSGFRPDPLFEFVYRNSVEHFFPQSPDREQVDWDRITATDPELNFFGNLALVSVGANSKFSNNLPENKVRFAETIKQSTKLQLMAKLAEESTWDKKAIRDHDDAMVALLEGDLAQATPISPRPERVEQDDAPMNEKLPAQDMLVEVAYPDDEVDHWWVPADDPRLTVKCTYCIRLGIGTEYPAHEVMVIRHWKTNTPNDPRAGWWAWYCPDHFSKTAPWESSLLAPVHLIPDDLEARIAADRDAAARAEADEFGKVERCIALARSIPPGRWTTFGDIGQVVFGNTRSGVAVGSALASLPITERFNSRVRMADGTCAASGRDLAQADEAALLDMWNAMAREDGLHVVARTGVAFAAYRMSIDELTDLATSGATEKPWALEARP